MTQNEVINLAKEDILLNGEFSVPTNHPDNELNCTNTSYYSEIMRIAQKLEEKGVLEISSSCRRVSSYKFNDDWINKQIKKDKSFKKVKLMQSED